MNNNIAAIAVCLKEADTKDYQAYAKQKQYYSAYLIVNQASVFFPS